MVCRWCAVGCVGVQAVVAILKELGIAESLSVLIEGAATAPSPVTAQDKA